MKRGIVLFFILVVFSINFALAYDTVIKINTLGDHELNLQFLNPSPPPISYNFTTLDSGSSGIVDYVFSNTAEVFDLSVFLMNNGKTVLHDKFDGITAGKTVMITFVPGLVEIDKDYQETIVVETENTTSVENETNVTNSTENQTNEEPAEVSNETVEEQESTPSSESSTILSGLFSGESHYSRARLFYYGGGALLLIIILFFVHKHISIRFKKSRKSKKKNIKETEENLEEAKRKLKEMQKKVDELDKKKQDKIKEAKRKLIEDEKELMKLRGEEKEKK